MTHSLMVGIPAGHPPSWELLQCLHDLPPHELVLMGRPRRPYPIEVARNLIVETFLQSDCEWLLQVDSDALWARGMVERLWAWEKPIVAPLAFSRKWPHLPFVWSEVQGPDDVERHLYRVCVTEVRNWLQANPGLTTFDPVIVGQTPEVGLAPSGFLSTHVLLTRRDVLEAVGRPWFERLSAPGRYSTGSDLDFSEKARRAGYRLFVDCTQWAGHADGTQLISPISFLAVDRIIDWNNHKITLGGTKWQTAG